MLGLMWGRLLLSGFLITVAAAFDPAPIRWGGAPVKRFILAPAHTGVSIAGAQSPQLVVMDSIDEIPRFVAKPDNTISLDGKGLCIEASGGPEFTVRLNHCLGGPSQRWNWLPWGPIQLKGTNQCLDVMQKEGDFNSAPVELRECENKVTESWKFEDLLQTPQRWEVFPSMKHAMLYFTSLLGVVGLVASLRLWRGKTSAAPMNQMNMPSGVDPEGGVALIEPSDIGQTLNAMTPAIMAISPTQALQEAKAAGATVVDLRSTAERAQNPTCAGALHLEWDMSTKSMPTDGLPEDKTQPIILH